jgi:SAM-dependent methyltransferase
VPDNYFDERVAERYDDREAHLFESDVVEPAVSFLAELAGPGPVLELGVGTGRLALPLARRGIPVHGVDLSEAMVARLRAKPGGEEIAVTIGDFATTKVGGRFTLAYLVRNTIANLTTQDQQVQCFQNVADQLEPGGLFVIELYVPELRRLPPGENLHLFDVTPSHVGFEEYDFARQIAFSHHFWFAGGRVETFSAPFRYLWPAELDLMARLAGMKLRERWADWKRQPFTGESRSHVSVYTIV